MDNRTSCTWLERSRADLYFFEELRKAIGEEAGAKWLESQSSAKSKTHSVSEYNSACSGPIPGILKNESPSSTGRDFPRAKSGRQPASNMKTCLTAERSLIEGILSNVDHGSDETFRETADLADLLSADQAPQPSKSITPKFKKTPSLEKKFGLLFTDAAHTILE